MTTQPSPAATGTTRSPSCDFVVVGENELHIEGLTMALVNAGLNSADGLRKAAEQLEEASGSILLVLYPNPVLRKARQLSGETPGSIDFDRWIAETQEILGVFRQNRRQVILADANAVAADPKPFIAEVTARTGLDVTMAPIEPEAAGQGPSIVTTLVAQALLAQHPVASTLAAELEASSLPLSAPGDINTDHAIKELGELGNKAPAERVTELEEENELLLLQLHQVQEELEAYFLKNREQEKELDKIRTRQSATENRPTRESMQKLQAELKALKQELGWSRQNVKDVHESLSWRVTAPMRAVLGVFKGKAK